MYEQTRGRRRIALPSTCLLAIATTAPALTAQWVQTNQITARDGSPGDYLGQQVALSGDVVISIVNSTEFKVQSAYLFRVSDGQQLHRLDIDIVSGCSDLRSVDVDDEVAVVGTHDDCYPLPDGMVIAFSVVTGEEIGRFDRSNVDGLMPNAQIGSAIALDGGVLVAGAWKDSADYSGAAYVFDMRTGAQLHRLVALDAEPDDDFGYAVAIDQGLIVVGSKNDDDACPSDPDCDSGSAYVFEASTSRQLFKLTANDGSAGDYFGGRVAISGQFAVIGAAGADDHGDNSGAVYVFDLSTGEQVHKLTAADAAEGDLFYRVVVSGSIAVIQSKYATYVFDIIAGRQTAKLADVGGSGVGRRADIEGDTVVVGDSRAGLTRGAIAAYERACFDVTGDSIVGVEDLRGILSAWGRCVRCPEDLTRNGDVDFEDLLGLLTWWGPCVQPGACCLPDGRCILAETTGGLDCVEQGGVYQGDNIECPAVECP